MVGLVAAVVVTLGIVQIGLADLTVRVLGGVGVAGGGEPFLGGDEPLGLGAGVPNDLTSEA